MTVIESTMQIPRYNIKVSLNLKISGELNKYRYKETFNPPQTVGKNLN